MTERRRRGSGPVGPENAVLRVALGISLAVHGLIHAMGVALLWRLGEPGLLRDSDVRLAPGSLPAHAFGALWLIAGAAFVVSATQLLLRRRPWSTVALSAAVLSIAALTPALPTATAGLVVDVAVGGFVVLNWISHRARVVAQ